MTTTTSPTPTPAEIDRYCPPEIRDELAGAIDELEHATGADTAFGRACHRAYLAACAYDEVTDAADTTGIDDPTALYGPHTGRDRFMDTIHRVRVLVGCAAGDPTIGAPCDLTRYLPDWYTPWSARR